LDSPPNFWGVCTSKYDDSFKLAVVKRYLTGKYSQATIAEQFGLSRDLVRNWLTLYRRQGAKGFVRTFIHHSAEFKHMVLKTMEREQLSYRVVAERFNIRNSGALTDWKWRYDFFGVSTR
jgi:transposase